MIPKKILELYPAFKDICKEDLQAMKEAERYMTIEDWKGRKVWKRDFKKKYPEDYYRALNRATFHHSTARDINWEIYYFRNDYLFN